MSIYLSVQSQESWFLAQKFQCAISLFSTLLAFTCLLTQTPPNQMAIRPYFISIQVILLITDIFIDFLCQPIALFPAPAAFCVGLLCKAGMTLKTGAVITMFLLTSIGFFVLSCCIYRHQMILPAHNSFKMNARSFVLLRIALFTSLTTLSLAYLLSPAPNTEHLLDSYVPNVTWIRDRGGTYYFQEITGVVKVVCWAGITALIIAASIVVSLFGHMFYVLSIEINKRSKSSTSAIRKSLTILFAQMVVPLALIFVPISTVFVSLLYPSTFSFEFLSSMCFIITLHPIGHNILLITLTPVYRRFLLSWVCCKKNTSRPFDILRIASGTKN